MSAFWLVMILLIYCYMYLLLRNINSTVKKTEIHHLGQIIR